MATFRLTSADELERVVLDMGILPYFACGIEGYSVEEMCAPDLLWDLDAGPWLWKGDVARRCTCAYGKFLNRKAAYISLELLPHFINYRRSIYNSGNQADINRDNALLKHLQENESLLSREWKVLGGYVNKPNPRQSPLEKIVDTPPHKSTKSTFDNIVTRLQMGGYVVTADFEYRYDAKGDRQGIGIARYTTPEALFGNEIILANVAPAQSLEIIITRLKRHPFYSKIDTNLIYKLLTVKKI